MGPFEPGPHPNGPSPATGSAFESDPFWSVGVLPDGGQSIAVRTAPGVGQEAAADRPLHHGSGSRLKGQSEAPDVPALGPELVSVEESVRMHHVAVRRDQKDAWQCSPASCHGSLWDSPGGCLGGRTWHLQPCGRGRRQCWRGRGGQGGRGRHPDGCGVGQADLQSWTWREHHLPRRASGSPWEWGARWGWGTGPRGTLRRLSHGHWTESLAVQECSGEQRTQGTLFHQNNFRNEHNLISHLPKKIQSLISACENICRHSNLFLFKPKKVPEIQFRKIKSLGRNLQKKDSKRIR